MPTSGRAPVIAHMAKDETSARFVLENIDHIKSLSVDGIVIRGDVKSPNDISNVIMRAGVTLSEAEVRRQLTGLEELNSGMKNYLLLNVDKPGELDDNAAWARAIENWKIVAKVAKEMGFEGILFDNEEYFTKWQNIEGDVDHTNDPNINQLRALASKRGREIMEAVNSEWPDAAVIVPHGAYVSDPYTGRNGWDWDSIPLQSQPKTNELAGAFWTGLVEGKGSGQKIVDGGEWYAQREEEDFRIGFEYRSDILPLADHMPWAIDPNVRENWAELVDQGAYLYTQLFRSNPMTAPIMKDVLARALRQSEGAVVIYSDGNADDVFDPDPNDGKHTFSFYDPNMFPSFWNNAIRDGIAEAELTKGDIAIRGTNSTDILKGRNGFDILKGGAGNDFLTGGGGADEIDGGSGFDYASYSTSFEGVTVNLLSPNRNTGDAKGDKFTSIEGVIGSNYNDNISGNNAANSLKGGRGFDTLKGGAGNDSLNGGNQADLLVGNSGQDLLAGGNGNDRIFGDGGFDTLRGGAGNDRLFGGDQADLLIGNSGEDYLAGGNGKDRLFGHGGFDTLEGGAGDDRLFGGDQADVLKGGADRDYLSGGKGKDKLFGNGGFDTIDGGEGNDILTGNENADTFVFSGNFGQDRITDFDARNIHEKIDLSGVSSITSFSDLMSNHVSRSGSDVIINAGGGNTIRLSDVSLSDLDQSDFLF